LGEKQLGIIREIINDPKISIVELSQRIGLGTTAIENNIAKFKKRYFEACRPCKRWTLGN